MVKISTEFRWLMSGIPGYRHPVRLLSRPLFVSLLLGILLVGITTSALHGLEPDHEDGACVLCRAGAERAVEVVASTLPARVEEAPADPACEPSRPAPADRFPAFLARGPPLAV